jgi:hypothetical protein
LLVLAEASATRDEALLVMDVYNIAGLSAERGEPVTLPHNDPAAAA